MNKVIKFTAGIALLLLVGCGGQYYYSTKSLNEITLGWTKKNIMFIFSGESKRGIPGMVIRAAQRSASSGKLLEVGELLLIDEVRTGVVSHWFLFEDGLLVQWGRPEDWRKAASRYEINYNPSPGVPLN